MNRPDVAIVLDSFGPGGVERVACHVANGLARSGLRVEIVVVEDRGPVRTLLDKTVSVVALGGLAFLPRGLRLLAMVPRLTTYVNRRAPRLVHSPGNHTHVAVALALLRARAKPCFVPKITNPILKQGTGLFKRGVRRAFYAGVFRRADAVVVLSPGAVAQLSATWPEVSERVTFLPNPYVRIRPAPSDKRDSTAPPVVLTVGRLGRQKDQTTMMRALAQLGERDWQLRIFGIGPDEEALRQEALRLGIADKAFFGGFLQDITPEYATASVFALSSRWEELPAALIEAMAAGCPVITTASSQAIIDLLADLGARAPTPVGDVNALAASLRAALDGKVPAVEAARLQAYDIDTACSAHTRLFTELIEA